jgi:hypothetical protein
MEKVKKTYDMNLRRNSHINKNVITMTIIIKEKMMDRIVEIIKAEEEESPIIRNIEKKHLHLHS